LYGHGESSASGARLGVSEGRVEAVDGAVRVVCRDARAAKPRLRGGVIPEREIENDNIATGGIYYLRYESSRPVTSGVAPNGDDDVLCNHRPGTGKNKEDGKVHHGQKARTLERALAEWKNENERPAS